MGERNLEKIEDVVYDLTRRKKVKIDKGSDIERKLKEALQNMWADLGDVLSEQTTGVASILGTLLRTGKVSTYTYWEQGWRS